MSRAIVIGTGPSLADDAEYVRELKRQGRVALFGINNTYKDFDLDVWIACDPKWHEHYGQVEGPFSKWHWDKDICERYGYRYIEGVWLDGLSLDPTKLSLGHSSGWQALNLAVLNGHDPICLVGYDMTYREGEPRHYFDDLSELNGEYPPELRKWSLFDKPDRTGLLYDYKHIAEQEGLPTIINCTVRSAMKWFPIRSLYDVFNASQR
jgi:hypothetical protein